MDIIAKINDAIINPLIVLLFAVAVAYFLFGLMQFIRNQNNDEMMADGKRHMFWGVVGIFLMIAVGGILNVLVKLSQNIY